MVTFKKPIGSVSVSGHKFVGAPVPCGVVITRKEYVEALSSDVEYLNSRDATIMGSRNGHAPLYLWYTLTKKGYEGMRKDVEKCLRNAHLLKASCIAFTSASCTWPARCREWSRSCQACEKGRERTACTVHGAACTFPCYLLLQVNCCMSTPFLCVLQSLAGALSICSIPLVYA